MHYSHTLSSSKQSSNKADIQHFKLNITGLLKLTTMLILKMLWFIFMSFQLQLFCFCPKEVQEYFYPLQFYPF